MDVLRARLIGWIRADGAVTATQSQQRMMD